MNEINSKNIESISLTKGDKNNNKEKMKDSQSMAKNYHKKYSVNKEIKEKKIIIIIVNLQNQRENNDQQNNVKFCSTVKNCLFKGMLLLLLYKNLGHMNSQIEERNININNILGYNEVKINNNIVKKNSSKSSLILLESENTLDV